MSQVAKAVLQACVLGGMGLAAAGLLSVARGVTSPAIAAREREDLAQMLSEVLPARSYDTPPGDAPLPALPPGVLAAYRGIEHGATQAVALLVESAGYGGPIRLVLGVDPSGTLLGVRVVSHSETPGLGDKIERRKSNWILSFDGKSLSDPGEAGWGVTKDGGIFDAFSGATITPRAVVRGVHGGLKAYAAHRADFLAPSASRESNDRPAKGTP